MKPNSTPISMRRKVVALVLTIFVCSTGLVYADNPLPEYHQLVALHILREDNLSHSTIAYGTQVIVYARAAFIRRDTGVTSFYRVGVPRLLENPDPTGSYKTQVDYYYSFGGVSLDAHRTFTRLPQ